MKSIPNSFTTYELTAQETILGQTLTSLNVAVIQNLMAQIAEEKLRLEFTPNDVLSYTQHEAFLKGQLDMLGFILASNDSTQSHVKEI